MLANRATYLRWAGVAVIALVLELSIAVVAMQVASRHPASLAATGTATPASSSPAPSALPSQSPTASGPSGRLYSAAAFYPPSGKVVLFGGLTSVSPDNQATNETWTWDGKSWSQLRPVNSPSARFGAGLVYDPVNQVLVLYGGSSTSGWNTDTWTWNGINWKQMSPPETPPGWEYSAMTYDATRKAVVLFVGAALWPTNVPVNQTWSWDGTTWTQVATPIDPNGGSVAVGNIAYDVATAQTIFVGPSGTWVLDPGGWRRLTGGGAQAVSDQHGLDGFDMVYDDAQGVLVEVGQNGDTWTWDGKAWTAQNPTAAPQGRSGEVLAYDALRRQVVLFGGAAVATGHIGLSDTWVWDGTTWKRVGQ